MKKNNQKVEREEKKGMELGGGLELTVIEPARQKAKR